MELTNLSYRSKYKKEEFEKLEKETIQLKETFILLNEIVKEQEVHIDTISDFIENSKQNIITSTTALNAGSLTTALQAGILVKPHGTSFGATGEVRFGELSAGG